MPIGFVDRVEHMEELRAVLAGLTEGRGGLRRADLITDQAMRERLLEGVPLNRAVLGDGEAGR